MTDKLLEGWDFIDWRSFHNVAAFAGVCIFGLWKLVEIAGIPGIPGKGKALAEFQKEAELLSRFLQKDHFDKTKGLFFNGPDREISYASQFWAILADAVSPDEAREILSCLEQCQEAFEPISPYLHHHLLDACRYAGGRRRKCGITCFTIGIDGRKRG